MFEGPEIQVQVKPHGNAKGSTPYFRTSDSTREQMLTVAAKHTPKLAIATMTKQQGGEMNVRSVSCLPRNREQISNIRRSTSSIDQNVLYSVMLECKRVQGSQEAFFVTSRQHHHPKESSSLTGSCKTWWDSSLTTSTLQSSLPILPSIWVNSTLHPLRITTWCLRMLDLESTPSSLALF